MAVYMIADIKITDNKWVPAYAASVHELVHKHGGKYLSRSGNVKTLEGNPLDTNLIALIQFPSTQVVKGFLADPKYAPFAAARKDGSESRFQLIDDTDLAGTIPYLPKGQQRVCIAAMSAMGQKRTSRLNQLLRRSVHATPGMSALGQ